VRGPSRFRKALSPARGAAGQGVADGPTATLSPVRVKGRVKGRANDVPTAA
jgi:hypothetical protein